MVRNILVDAMSAYPKQVRLLPSVVLFDEFKADTKMGKYALIMNDLLHKRVIGCITIKKNKDPIKYLENVDNRSLVQYVVSDMYEPYLIVTQIISHKKTDIKIFYNKYLF